ncbi:MAG: hypothetical protein ACUBOA_12445 [Candidatus Loosdrechtia sp.]|uniref:hypothetical protein n=1 Tax=Candidatus Loosdrechtia sp. TaxID=3101272 RepID=UPI003A754685|nr:MAG: hypothetical protein QY305_01960 [Candidatus Jettenia sp. AMX2]
MGKDSALGSDPLSWMKIASENKKTASSKGEESVQVNNEKPDLRLNLQERSKSQASVFVVNNKDTRSTTGVQQPAGKPDGMHANIASASLPKVAIGRLYEKPSAKEGESVSNSQNVSQEKQYHVRPPFYGMRTLQPTQEMGRKITQGSSLFSSGFSTYIIVAYTALMLILGYLVYNDFSKRTGRIEARLSVIEKALQSRK